MSYHIDNSPDDAMSTVCVTHVISIVLVTLVTPVLLTFVGPRAAQASTDSLNLHMKT